MLNFLRAAVALTLLLGCAPNPSPPTTSQATVDLSYAGTSLGFRNSGALSAGRLFLWDLEENTLASLSSDVPLTRNSPTIPATLEASSVQGAAVVGTLNASPGFEGKVESEVRRNLSFTVVDAVRVDAAQTYSGLSEAYRRLQIDGVDAYRAWRVADATQNPNRYKFVLLTDEVRALEERVLLDNSASGSASFRVIDELAGEVLVTIPSNVSASCSGDNVTCYVNASVLTVFINSQGNLDYSPYAFSRKSLAEALRKL